MTPARGARWPQRRRALLRGCPAGRWRPGPGGLSDPELRPSGAGRGGSTHSSCAPGPLSFLVIQAFPLHAQRPPGVRE